MCIHFVPGRSREINSGGARTPLCPECGHDEPAQDRTTVVCVKKIQLPSGARGSVVCPVVSVPQNTALTALNILCVLMRCRPASLPPPL